MLISGKESNIEPSELRKHTVYVFVLLEPNELRKHTVYAPRLCLTCIQLLEYTR